MTETSWVARHGRSILAVVLALTLAGGFAGFSLPVGLFPTVMFPRIVVDVDAGTRPADQTALLVTIPIERDIRAVLGVRRVRSTTSRGSVELSVDFDWGTDMVSSMLQVDTVVAQALPGLPSGTSYRVRRMDPTVYPIIAYGLTSKTVNQSQLYDIASFQIVPLLSAINGVARVDVQGGTQREIQVLVDPHLLAARGLALGDVATALSTANVLTVVGRLQDHDKLYLLAVDDTFRQIDQVRSTVVRGGPSGVVHVSDVAEVAGGIVPHWTETAEDGEIATLFQVYQQPSANSVAISASVRQALAAFALPAGVKLSNWYDQSVLVTQSASSVRDAVLIGLGLAALVLFAFLRSYRVTLVAMLVVPATLATTVLLLKLLGESFNIMTLGGIAAAVGLLIDDVIVMVEHIARRAGTAQGSGSDAVLPAAREFLPPLTGSSLATLFVFLPLGFLTGVTGAFFKALSLTMASALTISYVFTALAVPVLSKRIIDFKRWKDPGEGPEGRVGHAHRWLLERLFARPWLIAIGLLPLLALGYFAYTQVGSGFMPKMDEGGFVLDYRSAPGTSLNETSRELAQVETLLRSTPDVDTFSRRTGTGLGGGLSEPNTGDFFVRLKSGQRRSIETVMAEVGKRVGDQVPGLRIATAQLMEDLIGDLTAVPQPIEIKLFSADPTTLAPTARKIADTIKSVPGVVAVENGIVVAGDGLNLQVDQTRAALEGVDVAQITSALDGYMTGTVATSLPEAHQLIGVRVWLPPGARARDDQLASLPIRAPDGHIFPLGRVATMIPQPGQAEITRENLQLMVPVTARIEGRSLGSTVADVKTAIDAKGVIGTGVTYQLGGLYDQQQIAFAGLIRVFGAALIAEFVLLLFLYERFWLPVIIVSSALLSTTAVFTGLWLTGVELNITSIMGMTMIIGIGTELSIFYVSEYVELAQTMPPRKALLEASRSRFRPIAMTTIAAILTLMPLALAIGQGSAMQQPLAIAIISGLLLQFPLVLLAMPVAIGLTLRSSRSRAVR